MEAKKYPHGTNIAPEKIASQKWKVVFQLSIFIGQAVSFRVLVTTGRRKGNLFTWLTKL